ncbi:hypothetical protein PLEOSDRAFT_162776 [Pleurotus ostreatus PC15]|uniref:Uncharacterized protein n=1 Tax=Pleurotus ostreatus (strain PC15) TaxID=1137138 RepID=A0A067NGF7_PLEO1|nr:hypothetical protein PLEOSDRAFT_162776 [Pleurotus ostreatus PC15]
MPSLRALHLHNIVLPPELPSLPHLTTLRIFVPGIFALRPSTLLSFIQRSPKLEEISVACLVKDETPELPRIRAKLLNLLRLSIEADDLETRAILANLSFFYFIRSGQSPSTKSNQLPSIHHFVPVSSAAGDIRAPGSSLSPCYYDGSAFFSVLALQTAPTSTLEGLKLKREVTRWMACSGAREHVRPPPLPLLQTITISKCRYTKGDHLFDSIFALRNLLKQRKQLEIPITKVTIMLCCIPERAMRDLEGEDSATIDWEGAEVYSGIEMMCYDDGLDNDIYASDESDDVEPVGDVYRLSAKPASINYPRSPLSLAHPDANIKTGPGDRLRTRTNGELIANMH